jgi:hypothetical protein
VRSGRRLRRSRTKGTANLSAMDAGPISSIILLWLASLQGIDPRSQFFDCVRRVLTVDWDGPRQAKSPTERGSSLPFQDSQNCVKRTPPQRIAVHSKGLNSPSNRTVLSQSDVLHWR